MCSSSQIDRDDWQEERENELKPILICSLKGHLKSIELPVQNQRATLRPLVGAENPGIRGLMCDVIWNGF